MPHREPEQPLSPELVLVSPDLRERASSKEPDAPSGTGADVPSPPATGAPAPATPAEPVLAPRPADPPPPKLPAEPPRPLLPPTPLELPLSTQTSSARVEWRLTVGAATVLALSALLIFGAGVAVGQLAVPSSTPRSASPLGSSQVRPTESAPAPAAAFPAGEAGILPRTTLAPPATTRAAATPSPRASPPPPTVVPSVPRLPSTSRAPSVVPRLRTSPSPAAPAHAVKPPAKPAPVRPAPSSGYAFFEGSFQLSPSGREIVRFTAQTTCAGQLVLPSIAVSQAGTFAFSGHPGGSPPGTTVRLRGRFASKAEVRGSMHVASNRCHDPATPFVAHLS